MTPMLNMRSVSGTNPGPISPVHLLLTECGSETVADNPERVMEEIWMRATEIGPVLEGILVESHEHPCWDFEASR